MRRVTLGLAMLAGAIVVAITGYVLLVVIDASLPGRPVSAYRNDTGAMDRTVLIGERFTVVSLRAEKGELMPVQRGDVIVHRWPPDTSKRFVKRIVALPGDTVAMIDGALRLNGRDVREPYARHEEPQVDPRAEEFGWQRAHMVGVLARDTVGYQPSRDNWGPVLLPSNAYFVLGDNRDNSLDSRYWGFLPSEDIVARARRIYFSREPATGRIRWSRFGKRIE